MASQQQMEPCSECKKTATWYCLQDDANFCDEHNTVAHSLKSQKSHKIVSIIEKDAILKKELAKPMNCKNHHMPLCLYCLSCRDVCCVACLSVDIHKQHSDQVKSVVDVADEEKKRLNEQLQKIQELETGFADEHKQLQQMLKSVDMSEAKGIQEIDREFDQIVLCVQARRKVLKEQLQEKSKVYRDNINLRQEDVKNISLGLKRSLEEGRHVLTLNDFSALSQSKTIIKRMKKLETESVEYHQQTQLIDSVPIHISSQTLLETVNALGTVEGPPAPSFIQEKCVVFGTNFDIEWIPTEYNPPITAYVLELGQNNNSFNEVYRGLETKYHLQGLKPNTSYVLRLCACLERVVGNASLLEMRTSNLDLNNWTLSMSSSYGPLNAENTRESLLDGQYTTGAASENLNGSHWIQASFSFPVPVTNIIIAPLHKNESVWGPLTGGTLQYSHDNNNWTNVGTIAYANRQQQTIATGGVTAQYWRLFHTSYVGTSSFVFQ